MTRYTMREYRLAMDAQSPDPKGGEPKRGRNVQHEAAEQRLLVQWVGMQSWGDFFSHWPNERQNRREAMSLKPQGVRRGMPDNWLFVPMIYPHSPPDAERPLHVMRPGAVSELKRQGATRSAVHPEQRRWLERLEIQRWAVGVHRGWIEAREFFEDYLAGNWVSDGKEWWR